MTDNEDRGNSVFCNIFFEGFDVLFTGHARFTFSIIHFHFLYTSKTNDEYILAFEGDVKPFCKISIF